MVSVMLPHWIDSKAFSNEARQIRIRPSPSPHYVETVYRGS